MKSKIQNFTSKNERKNEITKIIMVGIAKAGKTTIQKQFFEHSSLHVLKKVKPTVNRLKLIYDEQQNQIPLVFYDLAGQTQYRKIHLRDQILFHAITSLIYVIDCQEENERLINTSISYFEEILNVLKMEKKQTQIYIFFHKFDGENEKKLMSKASLYIDKLRNILTDYKHAFYFTSIFGESAKASMAQVLFRSSPRLVTKNLFEKDFFLSTTIEFLTKNELKIIQKNKNEKQLLTDSLLFGKEKANETLKNLTDIITKKPGNLVESIRSNGSELMTKPTVSLSSETQSQIIIRIKYSGIKVLFESEIYKTVLNNIITGFGGVFGFTSSLEDFKYNRIKRKFDFEVKLTSSIRSSDNFA